MSARKLKHKTAERIEASPSNNKKNELRLEIVKKLAKSFSGNHTERGISTRKSIEAPKFFNTSNLSEIEMMRDKMFNLK